MTWAGKHPHNINTLKDFSVVAVRLCIFFQNCENLLAFLIQRKDHYPSLWWVCSAERPLTDLACVVMRHHLCVTRVSLLSFQIPGGPLWPQTPPSANRSVWHPPRVRVSVYVCLVNRWLSQSHAEHCAGVMGRSLWLRAFSMKDIRPVHHTLHPGFLFLIPTFKAG